MLSAVLVVLLALGATLAYLSAITDQKENAFSFAENIKGILEEPNWDPKNGEDLIPGAEIPKDPFIRNVSNNGVDEWAAIRLNFTDGHGDPLSDDPDDPDGRWVVRLLRLLDIDWNTADWELIDASNTELPDSDMADAMEQVWAYKDSIAPGEATTPLFTTVTIKPAFTAEDFEKYGDDLDWDTEFAWLASMVMDHTDSCYELGTCDCNPTWRHHPKCAIFDMTGAENVAQGMPLNDVACDCVPVANHRLADPDADPAVLPCPGAIAMLTGDCGHTGEGIDGFQIIVRGAVVQAYVDGMDAWNSDSTLTALVALFAANPYTP
jgi:predicted ribosomally synthesized peptide with SipW-like signal peptide